MKPSSSEALGRAERHTFKHIELAAGFRYSGIHAGIKGQKKDLALVLSDTPAAAAACFTQNKAKAAPIIDAEGRFPHNHLRAVLLNSGNANALTGPEGVDDVVLLRRGLAEKLNIDAQACAMASTGVIGVRMPAQRIADGFDGLIAELGDDPERAAEAIMTTDLVKKTCSRTLILGGKRVTLTAIGKGSGMIAPQLATMLAVITTDAAVTPALLQDALSGAMPKSFNCLTVDNDMSTNDAVFLLANGAAGAPKIDSKGKAYDSFCKALAEICIDLARQIAADGEGATKRVEVKVSEAPNEAIATDIAKSIAGSSLVKAAIFGADPNWGRILATVGARAGSQGFAIAPQDARVTVQGMVVYDKAPVVYEQRQLRAKMREPEIAIDVALRSGNVEATAWGCDLSYDYVKINADYSSLIVSTQDGAVTKDNRFTNYGPALKVSLLVEALSYIQKFAGKLCVIKYGGAAMVDEGLKQSFCNDVHLLRSVGLKPVIVHGGGPEISKVLDRLGSKRSEFIDGVRVTDASDLKVVEMVLTGSINTSLVTQLNRTGASAIGVSGKDAALLRAKKIQADDGRDLGQVGDVTSVNRELLEMFLQRGYVPVISPVGIGHDGESYNINADVVASAVATALGADKLIYLSDVPGILDESGQLISETTDEQLKAQTGIAGGMKVKVKSILDALAGGVGNVHVIDGRTPHTIIAELFTDKGVGTLASRSRPS